MVCVRPGKFPANIMVAQSSPKARAQLITIPLITASRDNGMTIMASDTPNRMEYRPGTNFSVSLSGDNEAELSAYVEKLSDGGTVAMPLEKAPWGDSFGMCTNKFGVSWLVNISPTSTV
jgi:PhnB protein